MSNHNKINNFILALSDLSVDDSGDLLNLESKLIMLKNQIELRKLDIETELKINMIIGMLNATAEQAYWYNNIVFKRKVDWIEGEPSSSNKKSKNG